MNRQMHSSISDIFYDFNLLILSISNLILLSTSIYLGGIVFVLDTKIFSFTKHSNAILYSLTILNAILSLYGMIIVKDMMDIALRKNVNEDSVYLKMEILFYLVFVDFIFCSFVFGFCISYLLKKMCKDVVGVAGFVGFMSVLEVK